MSLSWDEVYQGVREAEATIRMAENNLNKMAGIMCGYLKSGKVSSGTLCKLKRELRDFNMITGKWKD